MDAAELVLIYAIIASLLLSIFIRLYVNKSKMNDEQAKRLTETEKNLSLYQQLLQESREKCENLESQLNHTTTELDQVKDLLTVPDEINTRLYELFDFDSMYQSIMDGRLTNAFSSNLTLSTLNITSDICSGDTTYNVSLTSCTCADFKYRHKPCKHILFLAYSIGLLQIHRNLQNSTYNEFVKKVSRYQELTKRIELLEQESKSILSKAEEKANRILNEAKKIKSEAEVYRNYYIGTVQNLDKYIKQKCDLYPHLAGLVADFLLLHYEKSSEILFTKKHPAITEAMRISDLRKETKQYLEKLKVLEYKLAYIEALFPNITDIFDSEFNSDEFELETDENTDRVRYYLSEEEYRSLSIVERNQMALDRYVASRKSKWQIGRDYEMYIGHQFESKGFNVEYTGIIKNLEDMGRDLIATLGKKTYIVQCKNWSTEKTIHEKHIFQLYGTVVLYKMDNPSFDVKGVFVTTTSLSPKAKSIAEYLGISVYENIELGDFPRIKCNVSERTGERIYHLPFDQQYDNTVIDAKKGEFYAQTVEEAEDQGFRRAWRHYQ